MKKNNVSKGKIGEDLAQNFLVKKGFCIIEKNWRFSRLGEIDIIAKDAQSLVFVEVKTKTSSRFGHPLEAVSEKKFARMHQLAEIYLSKNTDIFFQEVRFDLIGIVLGNAGNNFQPEITYLKSAY